MKVPILLLVALAAGGSPAGTPTPTPGPEAIATAPVSVREIARVVAPIGGATSVRIPLAIAAGYRIQSNPASNDFLVPLEVQLENAGGVQFGGPVYPTP